MTDPKDPKDLNPPKDLNCEPEASSRQPGVSRSRPRI